MLLKMGFDLVVKKTLLITDLLKAVFIFLEHGIGVLQQRVGPKLCKLTSTLSQLFGGFGICNEMFLFDMNPQGALFLQFVV